MDVWEERQTTLDGDQRERGSFSRDRARVIHSAFFRRLQGKTQVLGVGESDFYRTRLTHSVEVAQVASGIVEQFESLYPDGEFASWIPKQNLIEAIALAHDIGHPPFGHGGEVALNYVMRDHGGFEGNAQTLRICTTLGEYSESSGLNLTRRTLLGLIKYPARYSSLVQESVYRSDQAPMNLDSFKPPKCIYDSDLKILDHVLQPMCDEQSSFTRVTERPGKHKRSLYKSFDTSILELADDIAYGVHDLEDAIALQLVNERQWNAEVRDILNAAGAVSTLASAINDLTHGLFADSNKARKKSISFVVGYFIRSCTIGQQVQFHHPLLKLQAKMDPIAAKELQVLKDFVNKNVISLPAVQALEFKGQQLIVRLFEVIANNPMRLLPEKSRIDYVDAGNSPRVICDYLAGTTDDEATRIYHKIFTPSSGSIFDRL